jgi:hypothetical protein
MLSTLMLSVFLSGGLLLNSAGAVTLATPSRSTTIALTADETRLVVVNREANTISIIQVKDAHGNDVEEKLAEIAVGFDPAAWPSTLTTRWLMLPTASPLTSRSLA